jgi:hypothetical protein
MRKPNVSIMFALTGLCFLMEGARADTVKIQQTCGISCLADHCAAAGGHMKSDFSSATCTAPNGNTVTCNSDGDCTGTTATRSAPNLAIQGILRGTGTRSRDDGGSSKKPPKTNTGLTPPATGLLEGGSGLSPQGPASSGGKRSAPSGGTGTIY